MPNILYGDGHRLRHRQVQGRSDAQLTDLFDLQKFPGKRALRKNPFVNLEWALIADGVPTEDVYKVLGTPEGVDRAFAKLDTHQDRTSSGGRPARSRRSCSPTARS